MAHELARYGVQCRLIEKKSHRPKTSRAIGILPRTMEVFDLMRVAGDFLAAGRQIRAINIFSDRERIVRIGLDRFDTPYAFALALAQDETERILEKHVLQRGIPSNKKQRSWRSIRTRRAYRLVFGWTDCELKRSPKGRVFLAGDAADIHSPMGAQGMNAGIQDAFNLAWKLGLAASQAARPEILDSCEAERMPIDTRIIRWTDWATRLLLSRGSAAHTLLGVILSNITRFESSRRGLVRVASQTGANYRSSPIVDLRQDLLNVHRIAEIGSAPGDFTDHNGSIASHYGVEPAAYLIRPDGWVAFRCRLSDTARLLPGYLGQVLFTGSDVRVKVA